MLKSEKPKKVEELSEKINSYSVIGIVSLHKMPTKQLQKIKHNIKEKTAIIITSKSVIKKALEQSKKENLIELYEKINQSPALILSNDNPFKLFSEIKNNEIPTTAKTGDIAQGDIVVNDGPTSIAPGPALTTLQKLKLKTSVQNGKIAIMQKIVVAKKGDVITEEQSAAFNLLKMEPMKIRLNVLEVWENGIIYPQKILDIDKDQYEKDLQYCISLALNLSVNIGYVTKENVEIIISKAFNEAKSLCLETDYIDKEFIGEILAKAVRQTKQLESMANIKTIDESSEKEEKVENEGESK